MFEVRPIEIEAGTSSHLGDSTPLHPASRGGSGSGSTDEPYHLLHDFDTDAGLLPEPASMSGRIPTSSKRHFGPRCRSPGANVDRRHGITLATVFIPESQGAVPVPQSYASASASASKPSRWNTTEFKVYAMMFVVVVPMMVWVPIRLSQTDHRNYSKYAHKLSNGWIPGRLIDMSDPQYRQFRNNLLSLLFMASAHLIVSTLFSRLTTTSTRPTSFRNNNNNNNNNNKKKLDFTFLFSSFLICILHGSSALKVFIIVCGNWGVTKLALRSWGTRRSVPMAIWGFNVLLLFANDWYGGYRFGNMYSALSFLDAYSGLLPRWHINFNITMLRLISFGMDWYWAVKSKSEVPSSSTSTGTAIDVEMETETETEPEPEISATTYRDRVRTPLPIEEYTLKNLVAYALYPPLYIAGPIITFNDFIWQNRQPVPISTRSKISYAIRFASCLLTMEVLLHFMYVVAIKDTGAWDGDSPAELSMIGLWNLTVVWLKLLIPWRFFRMWALLDGIDPPENMVRCMANNYSTLGFWRSWHRSYNLWVVRYVYIPLGGNHNLILATLSVFTFVALWHDLSFRLLTWGWLISLFILPEILATRALPEKKYSSKWWYRHICAFGGVINVLMMMTANLIGFAIGVDGVRYLFSQLLGSTQGFVFLIFASVCLFVAIQAMFEYREEEKRQGINRKC